MDFLKKINWFLWILKKSIDSYGFLQENQLILMDFKEINLKSIDFYGILYGFSMESYGILYIFDGILCIFLKYFLFNVKKISSLRWAYVPLLKDETVTDTTRISGRQELFLGLIDGHNQ